MANGQTSQESVRFPGGQLDRKRYEFHDFLPQPYSAKVRAWWIANPKKGKPVIQLSPEGREIKRFKTIMEAARAFGGGRRNNIYLVCKGKRQFCFGFKWAYAIE